MFAAFFLCFISLSLSSPLRVTFGVFWWWILACCWKSPSLSHFQFELKSFCFVYLFKPMTQVRCADFGWDLLLLYFVWLILPFFTEICSNSSQFVTVLCKTFQEPKKSNNPEKTFPSPLSDGESENLWKVLENVPS